MSDQPPKLDYRTKPPPTEFDYEPPSKLAVVGFAIVILILGLAMALR